MNWTSAQSAAYLARNAMDCLPEGGLERKLSLGRPLRVKLGIDPTAPDIHLGFTVVLQKLREFQELGHTVVLILGDYTARVGDPSGRSATRPVLSGEQIDANAITFQQQALKVLEPGRLEVVYNSDWLDMRMAELFGLLGAVTVAQVLERDDFAKRFAAGASISMLELLYPLLQGYDSVAVNADVELGGTDQKFNLLMGRGIQRHYGQDQQVILTMPLLTGIDGKLKMSKSFGNYIGVTEPPDEIYGKTVSIPDEALPIWYELLLGSPPPAGQGPWEAKRALARGLVERFHSAADAERAEKHFDQVHRHRELPDEMPVLEWVLEPSGAVGRNGSQAPGALVHLPALLVGAFGGSTSQARREILQGAVKLDGETVLRDTLDLPAASVDGKVLQRGRRNFARVRMRALGADSAPRGAVSDAGVSDAGVSDAAVSDAGVSDADDAGRDR